jgi:hypothetical protein
MLSISKETINFLPITVGSYRNFAIFVCKQITNRVLFTKNQFLLLISHNYTDKCKYFEKHLFLT